MAIWTQSRTGETLVPTLGQFSSPTVPDSFSPPAESQPQPQPTPVAPSVDSGALIDMAIQRKAQLQEQRQGITSQRSQLINQLAATPAGKRGAPQMKSIEAQLHGLDRAENDLDRQDKFVDFETSHRMSSAYRDAANAEKFSKDNLAHQTASEAGEVFLRGTEIMGKYKPGTQEFQDAMAKLKEQYPLGFASEAVKGHFGQIAKFHDQEMDRNIRSMQSELFKETRLSPEQFAGATNIRATDAPIGTKDSPTTLDVIEKGRADKGKNIAFDVDGTTHLMTKSFFNNLSKSFRQQPTRASVAVSAQPQAEPIGMVSTQKGQPLRPISPQAVAVNQAPVAPQFTPGKRYKDAQGNEAVFNADGTWMPVTK